MHHDLVDQTSHKLRFIYWIWQYISFCNWPFTWHSSSSFLILTLFIDYFFSFGFLSPYLERPCILPSTPAVSSATRTMRYRTPGKSFTRPPLSKTTLCS